MAVEGFDRFPTLFDTLKEDLEFTEYFKVYGPFPYRAEQFDPNLWKSSNVEIVVRAETYEKILIKIFFSCFHITDICKRVFFKR